MSIDTDVLGHGHFAQVRASLSEEFTVQLARLREFTQLNAHTGDTGDPGDPGGRHCRLSPDTRWSRSPAR